MPRKKIDCEAISAFFTTIHDEIKKINQDHNTEYETRLSTQTFLRRREQFCEKRTVNRVCTNTYMTCSNKKDVEDPEDEVRSTKNDPLFRYFLKKISNHKK